MTNKHGKHSAAAVGVLLALLAAGCADSKGEDGGTTSDSNDKPLIGIAMPTQQEERWQRDYQYFEEEAAALGVDIAIQVADNDSNKQLTQIESLLTQGVDALIIAAVDASAVGPVAQSAVEDGIPVIGYARTVEDADIDALVAFDYLAVGELAGEYAYELAPEGQYVLLQGDAATLPDVPLYHQGHLNGIQPGIDSGAIEVVLDQNCEQWKPEQGLAFTENALTEHDNIVGILAANDGIASGAIQALEAQGLAGKVVVTGNDGDLTALQRIVAGTQMATIYQDTRKQAKVALETAIALVNGESVEADNTMNNGLKDVPVVELQPELVTKDSLDEVIIDRGIYTREEVYGE
jgi:D-xylose transport system substrate-binding protein